MYTFSGTGTKTNVITTGTVNMSFENGKNVINVDNQYPMEDSVAITKEENQTKFSVTANWGSAPLAIKYDIGILTPFTEGDTLKEKHIKIALVDGSGNILVGTQEPAKEIEAEKHNLTGGTLMSELKSQSGDLIKEYWLANGLITNSGQKDEYTLYAWVDKDYNLPYGESNDDSSANVEAPSTTDGNDQSVKHEKTTKSETFSFKIKVQAEQLIDED